MLIFPSLPVHYTSSWILFLDLLPLRMTYSKSLFNFGVTYLKVAM